ncbi:efflux RND transporter periplasmic adaptor subunit [Parasediminibacterium sp. JCM 36343]|uniref:efflux RND transporter periplasmic adaptor subunit n=1 Tax=Parasediminibacterium sp. JCM 36343 TaxID=3374279 RepID=UPI00397B95C9
MKQTTFIASALLFMAITSCHEKQPVKEEAKKFSISDSMAKMIAIDSVQNCFISDAITLSGEINFNDNSVNKVFPRGSGQVIESKVSLGDKVTEGQVLAVIKSADIAGNYADLSSANADIAIAQRQLDNTQSLYKNGIASERELLEAKQNYEKAKAAKNKIESVLSINGGKNTNAGGTYVLTAPTSGYVVEKKVNAGNYIRPDMGDYLFTISDLKDVWVNANVFEADIPKIKEGYEVEVTTLAYPDKVFKGKIDKVSEVLDPTNKAMKVRVKLDNAAGLLKPEMFAKVTVSNEQQVKALCLPTKALINQDGKSFVVIYRTKDDMRIAEVNILKTVGDKTYINSGATEGDKLIVTNQLLVFQQLLDTP